MLAYSTISQLGYMFLGCGAGVFAAGIFHLMTHAFFKSLLFLAAGSVMHAMGGELDMRKMGGLRHKLKTTHATFLIATLAISGVPMFAGFFSKDEILAGAYEGPLGKPLLFWLGTFTAGLTAFYMFRGLCDDLLWEIPRRARDRAPPAREQFQDDDSADGAGVLFRRRRMGQLAQSVGMVARPSIATSTRYSARPPRLCATFRPSMCPGSARQALMGFSILAAAAGIGIALWWYLKSTNIPDRMAERYADLYRILTHKYYVDEFYNWLIVRPLCIVSDKFLWRVVDAGAIDNVMVNGTGESTARRGQRLAANPIRQYYQLCHMGPVGRAFVAIVYPCPLPLAGSAKVLASVEGQVEVR